MSEEKVSKHHVGIALDEKEFNRINSISELLGCNRSDILKNALDFHIKRLEQTDIPAAIQRKQDELNRYLVSVSPVAATQTQTSEIVQQEATLAEVKKVKKS